jgi:SAM-dependent methyltransferase
MSTQNRNFADVTKPEPAINQTVIYDTVDRYIGEIYDQYESQHDDLHLIRSLIGDRPLRILEPFCGHGKLLIPLAEAGHEVVGLDLSEQFIKILGDRVESLPKQIRGRVSFRKADVVAVEWPRGFDVVVLGANCFFELATPKEQEYCIRAAAESLGQRGHVYIDNDHVEKGLPPEWLESGIKDAFPTGVCSDGTHVQGTIETIWHDVQERLVRFRRTTTITMPDGSVQIKEWIQQKHPSSKQEICKWLENAGFEVENLWGDQHRSPFSDESNRAVFWARKQ